jgi:hypothetical protein
MANGMKLAAAATCVLMMIGCAGSPVPMTAVVTDGQVRWGEPVDGVQVGWRFTSLAAMCWVRWTGEGEGRLLDPDQEGKFEDVRVVVELDDGNRLEVRQKSTAVTVVPGHLGRGEEGDVLVFEPGAVLGPLFLPVEAQRLPLKAPQAGRIYAVYENRRAVVNGTRVWTGEARTPPVKFYLVKAHGGHDGTIVMLREDPEFDLQKMERDGEWPPLRLVTRDQPGWRWTPE